MACLAFRALLEIDGYMLLRPVWDGERVKQTWGLISRDVGSSARIAVRSISVNIVPLALLEIAA